MTHAQLARGVRAADTKDARSAHSQSRRRPGLVALALLAFAAITTCIVVEPVRVTSGSMRPTLRSGDHIIASTVRYGVRLPTTRLEVLRWAEPQRGDVVVFRFPLDPRRLYIKRVVATPGDTIEMRDGDVLLDGKPLATQPVDAVDGSGGRVDEERVDGARYRVLRRPASDDAPPRAMAPRRVPADRYFVLGDDRDDSDDSRAWGFVARNDIVGKAEIVWLATRSEPQAIDWGRSFSRIR